MVHTPDLSNPATVLWIPDVPATGAGMVGEQKDFDRLDQAVRFVMEKISPNVRGTTTIDSDGSHFTIEDIERLYVTLSAGSAPP